LPGAFFICALADNVLIITIIETLTRSGNTMSEKKWLVALIEIDEDRIALEASENPYGQLPDALHDAIETAYPNGGLSLDAVYLHGDSEKDELVKTLEKLSVPYHIYTTEDRGEPCKEPFCTDHRAWMVVSLDDYRH
jgi:hypothetical protein